MQLTFLGFYRKPGYVTKKEHVDYNFNAANNLWKYLEKNGWRVVDENEPLQPGDILCYNHHVAIYGGRGEQYDAGNKELLEHEAPCEVQFAMKLKKVLRAPDL